MLLALAAPCARAQFVASGIELGAALPAGFEASGADWHAGRDEIVVVSDDGRIARLSPDGALRGVLTLAGDFEGVCVADPNLDRVYVAREKPEALLEVDLSSGFVLRTFDLTGVLSAPDQRSIEAVDFLPDATHPEGGTFFVGSTFDGRVHELSLPVATSASSDQVTWLGAFTPANSNDLRGIDADADAGVLHLLYSGSSAHVRVVQLDGTLLATWPLPSPQVTGSDAEGLARRGCDVFVVEDHGSGNDGDVARFDGAAGASACRSFEADVATLSAFFGGAQHLTLDLGPGAAGWAYAVLGSGSLGRLGPTPDGLVLPLSIDTYFLQTLGGVGAPFYSGFTGVLDGSGTAVATIQSPPFSPVLASLVGTRLFHAAVAIDPSLGWFAHASNAVSLTIAF